MAQGGGGGNNNGGNGGGGNTGGGGSNTVGGGGNKKPEEVQPHPVKEQLPGIQYCINSPPPWRPYSSSYSYIYFHSHIQCIYIPFFFFALWINSFSIAVSNIFVHTKKVTIWSFKIMSFNLIVPFIAMSCIKIYSFCFLILCFHL